MNAERELPESVLAAIRENRKIDAIKLLREQGRMDLKDAKDTVDAYIAGLEKDSPNRPPPTDFGIGRVVIAGVVAAAIYVAYKFLA